MDLQRNILAILINYNGVNDTVECIESLQQQTYPINILVVDNGSNIDEGQGIKEIFNDVVVIRSDKNRGFSGGNNLGIKYALENHYEYVLLINNDTITDQNMVFELMKNSDKNQVTVPKMYYYSLPDIIWYAGGYINKQMGTAYHMEKQQKDIGQADTIKICDFATGCCMLIPIDVINKIGMLDESYFMYYEDVDYCISMLKNNIKIVYCPQAKLWHKVSQSAGNDESAFNIYYMTRNRLRTIKKHKDFFSVQALLVSILTRSIRMMQMIVKGKKQGIFFIRAIWDYFKGISGMIEINR